MTGASLRILVHLRLATPLIRRVMRGALDLAPTLE